jgi:hypothetical protein
MSTIERMIRSEIASIGAIESAAHHEKDPGYTILFHATKTGKQASVEQLNTLLRMAGRTEVETGGMMEPVIRLQTLALQRANTTAMLQAMSVVEEALVAGYRSLAPRLHGTERRAVEHILRRSAKQWMILLAHIARRKDGESHARELLPRPLSEYFATDDDRVCMRCLLDRPGTLPSLEKSDPYTYVCAACHDDVMEDVPPDLQVQIPQWSSEAQRDRAIHRALGRPEKLRAIKEVHAVLAGLEPEIPLPAAAKRDQSPPVDRARRLLSKVVPSDLLLARDGASDDELAYTDLLFDFRSVRRNW